MMKTIKFLSTALLTLVVTVGCMNDFDTLYDEEIPYGNNSIGNSNTTIAQLKAKYATTINNSFFEEVTDSMIIKGVVVANDESGNIYKQFVISDGTGCIVVGVNSTGLYSFMQVGQMVVIDCHGLYIGGYGKLPQVGYVYYGDIGRIPLITFKEHVKLVGVPTQEYNELTPMELTESWMTDNNMASNLPIYVKLPHVKFNEADGKKTFAPAQSDGSTVVQSTVNIGSKQIIFRISTYANFANVVIPSGYVDIVGVLTRYNNYWQFLLTNYDDITPSN